MPSKKNKDKKKMELNKIDQIVKEIREQFDESILFSLKDKSAISIPVYSTGIMSIDSILGVNGVPKGRIVEIYGPESQGKTTLALHIIAEIQKNGGLAAFIDAEHALDVNYARKIGVDIENLLIAQPDYGEQALDIVKVLVKTNKMAVIVVDSVSALVPKEELEATMEKASIALQARMMSKHLRQITSALGKNSITSLIFINQVRERVGIMFGNPEDTTGGRALKFYSTIRIDVRKRGQSRRIVKKGDSPEAIKCHIRVVKNKVAPPFQECDFEIIFGKGIDKIGDIITHAVKLNIIKKGDRGLYTYKEEKFHGENRMMKYFEKDEHFRKLKNRILKKLKGEWNG